MKDCAVASARDWTVQHVVQGMGCGGGEGEGSSEEPGEVRSRRAVIGEKVRAVRASGNSRSRG